MTKKFVFQVGFAITMIALGLIGLLQPELMMDSLTMVYEDVVETAEE